MKKELLFLEEIFSWPIDNPFKDKSVFGDEVVDAREIYSSLREATEDLYWNLIPEVYEQNDEEVRYAFSLEDLYQFLLPYWERTKFQDIMVSWKYSLYLFLERHFSLKEKDESTSFLYFDSVLYYLPFNTLEGEK